MSQTRRSASFDWPPKLAGCPRLLPLLRLALRTQPRSKRCLVGGGVRDLLLGKRLYREFSESPEGIPTNILADRLKRLQAEGIVTREPYQERPLRYAYQLTEKGEDLLPVLAAIARWANHYIPGTVKPPAVLAPRLAKVRKRRGW